MIILLLFIIALFISPSIALLLLLLVINPVFALLLNYDRYRMVWFVVGYAG